METAAKQIAVAAAIAAINVLANCIDRWIAQKQEEARARRKA